MFSTTLAEYVVARPPRETPRTPRARLELLRDASAFARVRYYSEARVVRLACLLLLGVARLAAVRPSPSRASLTTWRLRENASCASSATSRRRRATRLRLLGRLRHVVRLQLLGCLFSASDFSVGDIVIGTSAEK